MTPGRRPGRGDATSVSFVVGDCVETMRGIAGESVDAIVCDPPYAIGWKGEGWDSSGIYEAAARRTGDRHLSRGRAFEVWCETWGAECLRLLKPGGHLLAFGSPRTYHRLTGGLEDAGLEVRDCLMWLYGTGMVKSRRYPGGRSASLKPAYEPIVLARKDPGGSIGDAIREFGTGGLEAEACQVNGRHPANLIASHEPACESRVCAPHCAVRSLDEAADRGGRGLIPPSRFVYCPKPSRREREAGCDGLPAEKLDLFPKAGGRGSGSATRNPHPTLKPIELMRWLVRLATPLGGIVLDPFAGSGTTGIAAVLEGRNFHGIEADPRYVEIAGARVRHWRRTLDGGRRI